MFGVRHEEGKSSSSQEPSRFRRLRIYSMCSLLQRYPPPRIHRAAQQGQCSMGRSDASRGPAQKVGWKHFNASCESVMLRADCPARRRAALLRNALARDM